MKKQVHYKVVADGETTPIGNSAVWQERFQNSTYSLLSMIPIREERYYCPVIAKVQNKEWNSGFDFAGLPRNWDSI
jgi:hypothetical protein